ncbi:MAG: hypothetical protein ACYC91_18945 [Solirubrobacteraceae bacterium]
MGLRSTLFGWLVPASYPPVADLSELSLGGLISELERRGWEALPTGALAAVVRELELRLATAELRAAAAEDRVRAAVMLGGQCLWDATRADAEADQLVHAIAGPQIDDVINVLTATSDHD